MTRRLRSPRTIAMIAFLFHGPGLRLWTSYRFSPALFWTNAAAVAVTIAATLSASVFIPDHRALAAALAFMIGHFAWSLYLSIYVYRATSG